MTFQDEPTIFREFFGDTPNIRVIEYLLEGRELDASLSDIAEGAGINRVTLFRLWPKLERLRIVMHTRNIGNAKLYKINMKNPRIKRLAEFFDKLVTEDFKKVALEH